MLIDGDHVTTEFVQEPLDCGRQTQQLVARIKRSSKYAYQAPTGGWFDVRVVRDMGYGLRGNNNNYRFSDVVFGIRLADGKIVELKS